MHNNLMHHLSSQQFFCVLPYHSGFRAYCDYIRAESFSRVLAVSSWVVPICSRVTKNPDQLLSVMTLWYGQAPGTEYAQWAFCGTGL